MNVTLPSRFGFDQSFILIGQKVIINRFRGTIMINNVFIMHESGLCLFSRTYGRNLLETDLLSGMLIAISSFARELMGEDVNEIRLDCHRIIYKSRRPLIISVITPDTRLSKRKLTMVMKKISQAFFQQFQEHLSQEIIEPQLYTGFTKILDEILLTGKVIRKKDIFWEEEQIMSPIY